MGRLVTSNNPETGEFAIFGNVTGQSAMYVENEDGPIVDVNGRQSTATTTVTVTFKYHVADMIGADQRAGSTAGSDQNRVRVTSSSDGIGEWVEVREVADIGSTVPSPTSSIYHGSIYLEPDSKIASAKEARSASVTATP